MSRTEAWLSAFFLVQMVINLVLLWALGIHNDYIKRQLDKVQP